MIEVRFVYQTGQKRPVFRNARLAGSCDGWTDVPMAELLAEDGCPAFAANGEVRLVIPANALLVLQRS